MSGILKHFVTVCVLFGAIGVLSGTANANWLETFDGNAFDLATWQFGCYPDVTKTYTQTIKDGPGDNDYLRLEETTSFNLGANSFGSAFGIGLGPLEEFTDVRVGAVLNVTGDSSWTRHGVAARISYLIDPDGSQSGAPGMIANAYIAMFHLQNGPANVKIELLKTAYNDDEIMETYEPEVPVPGLDHARSHYVELDVVGSDPVYITASVYDYKGGPLLVRTPTFVDTNANDPWERPGIHDGVYTSGFSGIYAINEDAAPAGYSVTFDSVSSVSDGPAAANLSPADGATNVPIDAALSWIEAEFATGRELWLGKAGAMEKVEPAPAGTTYTPGNLELGQSYKWRVDQVGPVGTVTSHTWSFETVECVSVDDFQSYGNDGDIRSAWIDNIAEAGVDYVFLAAGDNNSMRFECQNQYPPYFTEITRTFDSPQDWTVASVETLSLGFTGEHQNTEHLMYMKLEDASGQSFTVEHPYTHACQSDSWRQWTVALGLLSDGGIDLTSVKKITIGLGLVRQ